ncbi:MAG: hypothetical protein ACRDRL_10655 [Sciscionella sp.]
MSDERVVCRAYCDRGRGAHLLGKVLATAEGLAVDLRHQVFDVARNRVAWQRVDLVEDEHTTMHVGCACGTDYPVTAADLVAAYSAGETTVVLHNPWPADQFTTFAQRGGPRRDSTT